MHDEVGIDYSVPCFLSHRLGVLDAVLLGLLAPVPSEIPWLRSAFQECLSTFEGQSRLLRAVLQADVAVLCLDQLRGFGLESVLHASVLEELVLEEAKSEAFHLAVQAVCRDLLNCCNSASAQCAFLKGIASWRLYGRTEQRRVGDIDLLLETRPAAIDIFERLLARGYKAAKFSPEAGTLNEVHDPLAMAGAYELCPLWISVELDATPEDASRIAQHRVGYRPSRRFVIVAGKLYARVPVELHFEALPGTPPIILPAGDVDTMPRLGLEYEVVFAMYKAYTDVIFSRKRKGFKLAVDVFRMLRAGCDSLNFAEIRSFAGSAGLPSAAELFLAHSKQIFGSRGPDPRSDIHLGPFDFGDFMPALFTFRWAPTELH